MKKHLRARTKIHAMLDGQELSTTEIFDRLVVETRYGVPMCSLVNILGKDPSITPVGSTTTRQMNGGTYAVRIWTLKD